MDAIVRQMQVSDLKAVLKIQAVCYDATKHESSASFLAKLQAAPDACFVATRHEDIVGYLVALPAISGSPPPLHAETADLPATPDCLYLHDLAIISTARRTGTAAALIQAFFEQVHARGYARASLTAVQQSEPFWRRHGFRPVPDSETLRRCLTSYGPQAQYLEWTRGSLADS